MKKPLYSASGDGKPKRELQGERLFQQGQIGVADFFKEAHDNGPNSLEFKAYFDIQPSHRTRVPIKQNTRRDGYDRRSGRRTGTKSNWTLLGSYSVKHIVRVETRIRQCAPSRYSKSNHRTVMLELKRLRGQSLAPKLWRQRWCQRRKEGGFWSKHVRR